MIIAFLHLFFLCSVFLALHNDPYNENSAGFDSHSYIQYASRQAGVKIEMTSESVIAIRKGIAHAHTVVVGRPKLRHLRGVFVVVVVAVAV